MSQIEPIYFGPDSLLFGIYHAAQGQPKKKSILIVPPLLNEYMRCHYALRKVAVSLSEAGYDVLRFDFRGTGNSKGAMDELTIDDWVTDIESAIIEVGQISGNSDIGAVAVRFGAALLCRASSDFRFSRVIFWDPIFVGETWYQKLQISRKKARAKPRMPGEMSDFVFMGHVLSPSFVAELVSAKGETLSADSAVLVKTEDVDEDSHRYIDEASEVSIDCLCDWETTSSRRIVAHQVQDAICRSMG